MDRVRDVSSRRVTSLAHSLFFLRCFALPKSPPRKWCFGACWVMYAELCYLNAWWFAAPLIDLRSSSFPLSYVGINTVHMQKLYRQIKDFTSCKSQIKNQTILTYRSHPLGSEEPFVLAREVRPPKMCQNHPEMKLLRSSREGPQHLTGSAP